VFSLSCYHVDLFAQFARQTRADHAQQKLNQRNASTTHRSPPPREGLGCATDGIVRRQNEQATNTRQGTRIMRNSQPHVSVTHNCRSREPTTARQPHDNAALLCNSHREFVPR
jgi:hypothetical protein